MKVPLNWLKEYVDINISQDELVTRLTAIGHMQDKKPENIAGDIVLDLEVRQNRSDCLSILGVAKEVAAVTGKSIKLPATSKVDRKKSEVFLKIINKSADNCLRFCAYKMAGLKSDATSPDWMVKKLEAYGMKSVSAVVDITNFVMIETGEPMHAFDSKSVPNGVLQIRQAKTGDKLTILGGKEISLCDDDLVVTDEKDQIISFSGLIGGSESGIMPGTSDIIIEAATYNQAVIRRSSIRHAIRTEASTRHEKFLHPELAIASLDRAVNLIKQICGGEVIAFDESYPKKQEKLKLGLRVSEVERLGGVTLDSQYTSSTLKSLNFDVLSIDENEIQTVVPYDRTDILEEADLVEEVLRIYGYENITSVLPNVSPPKNITSSYFKVEEAIRDTLLPYGFSETITEPLVSKTDVDESKAIPLQNALNADKSYLRTTLVTGLKRTYSHHQKYLLNKIYLFEIGKVYEKSHSKELPYLEVRKVGILLHENESSITELSEIALGIVHAVCENAMQLSTSFDDIEIIAIDKNTVFAEFVVQQQGEESRSVSHFFENIPHFAHLDISVSLPKDTNPAHISKKMKALESSIYDISYETNDKLAPQDQMFVLFKMTLVDLEESKDAFLSRVSGILTADFNATLR